MVNISENNAGLKPYNNGVNGFRLHKSQGFTLIEMMVVVVILSIFAAMLSLSVGSSESRKNLAFYEHLIDSLTYVRLVSSETMQPMGLALHADKQGQVQPVIVKLDNPYATFAPDKSKSGDAVAKNAMELSAMTDTAEAPQPTWQLADEIELPTLPKDVKITIITLEDRNNTDTNKTLQPWFTGNQVPQVLWFGTGGAAPVRIEIRHNERLVGDAIVLTPDGRLITGQER